MKKNYKSMMESINSIISKSEDKSKSYKSGLLSPSYSPSKKDDDVMGQVARYIKTIRDKKKEFINET
jgi:hypothetical protein